MTALQNVALAGVLEGAHEGTAPRAAQVRARKSVERIAADEVMRIAADEVMPPELLTLGAP